MVGNGVTICAVYPTVPGREPNTCEPGGAGKSNTRDNDTVVHFDVRVPYGVGFVGRTILANKGGAKYPVQWNTLLYSFDYWAVVRNSPNKAEAMKLISYMTDEKPLTALAQDWAVSPANAKVANDPAIIEKNPGMVANHAKEGLFIGTEFWVENGADLEAKFNAWVAK